VVFPEFEGPATTVVLGCTHCMLLKSILFIYVI
jgi:glutamate racemase